MSAAPAVVAAGSSTKKKRKSEAAAMDVDGVQPTEETPKKKSKKDKKSKDVSGVADVSMTEEKKEKKEKKDKKDKDEDKPSAFHVPADAILPIASPLAPPKLSRRLFRLIKKSSKARQLKRGVKEVIKALRKGEKGLLVLAANITPLDVISHLPVLAEETAGVEYCWVPSKEELGVSSGTKRATSCVLICSTPRRRPAPKDGSTAKPAPTAEEIKEWQEPLMECIKEVKALEGQRILV